MLSRSAYNGFLYLSFLVLLLSACGLDKLNLDERDNELIPNYSTTLDAVEVNSLMRTGIISIDDNNIILSIEDINNMIQVIQIKQEFINEEWTLSHTTISDINQGKISFFNRLADEYLIGYNIENGTFTLQLLDENFNIANTNNSLESFIDTFYNDIDSLFLSSFAWVEEKNEILLGGQVYSQGTSFSCLLNLDRQLNPIWIKTYFENSNIVDVTSVNRDTFYVINNSPEGGDLIRDNENSQAYTKYDLSNDQLFFGVQTFIDEERLFLTGIHNDIGRTIELDINSGSVFINEVEIYPVTDLRAVFLIRDNIVTAGIQKENGNEYQFSSEVGAGGSLWCHRYIDETYNKILDIVEMPGKGILIASIVERESKYYLHLTRIDEEGATFINEYSENCI